MKCLIVCSVLLLTVCFAFAAGITCYSCQDCSTKESKSCINSTAETICMGYAYSVDNTSAYVLGCLDELPQDKAVDTCYDLTESGVDIEWPEDSIGKVCYCSGNDCNDWTQDKIEGGDVSAASMMSSSLLLLLAAYCFAH